MPRPLLCLVTCAVLALAPLHAQQSPAASNPVATAPSDGVSVPELTELASTKSPVVLMKLVQIAKDKTPGIPDAEERALTQLTLDAITDSPADAEKLLKGHVMHLARIRNKIADTIFLTGLSACKSDEEVVRYSRETYASAAKVGDPALRLAMRLTLAKLEDKPGDAPAILKAHLKTVGDRFYAAARASFDANDVRAALESIQIAVRCDPENVKARFLFAHLLHAGLRDTSKAIQTLRVGLAYLEPKSPETSAYLDRYFQLLESREEDAEVITQAGTLLGKEGFDDRTREMLAMHLATCLYFTGRNEDAVHVIEKHELGKRAQGVLLMAKSLFDGKHTDSATRLLEGSTAKFNGAERDAILSQLQRFWTDLGKTTLAISVAEQRIQEFPQKSSPRVHRLWLYERAGDTTQFAKESRLIFERFSEDQGAMIGVANLAAERGLSSLAADCFRRAQANNFNRPLFSLLVLEAHVNAKEYRQAVVAHENFIRMDKTIFKSCQPTVDALLAAAKTGLADPVAKSEAERHIKAYLDAGTLPPESYISAARLIRRAGNAQDAVKILEAGRRAHPWNNQIRADLAGALILTGQTEAYGTRPPVADELIAIAKGRRVNPRLWDTVGFWLQTEAKMPVEKLRSLREIAGALARPDLAKESIRD
jgi:tetratricopeptide (TPR) repeat protein